MKEAGEVLKVTVEVLKVTGEVLKEARADVKQTIKKPLKVILPVSGCPGHSSC